MYWIAEIPKDIIDKVEAEFQRQKAWLPKAVARMRLVEMEQQRDSARRVARALDAVFLRVLEWYAEGHMLGMAPEVKEAWRVLAAEAKREAK